MWEIKWLKWWLFHYSCFFDNSWLCLQIDRLIFELTEKGQKIFCLALFFFSFTSAFAFQGDVNDNWRPRTHISLQVDPISYGWFVKYKNTGWRTALPCRNWLCLHLHCYLVFQSRFLADVKNFSKKEKKKEERKHCLELLSDSSARSSLQMTHTPETWSTVFRKDSTVSAYWVPPT